MGERNSMKNAKLVCFRSEVLLQEWITFKAMALQEKSWIMHEIADEKYDHLKNHLLSSCTTLHILVDMETLIFDKAVLEPTFCSLYAQLCYDIHDKLPTFWHLGEKIIFKRLLLNSCQAMFEGFDQLSEELKKMNTSDREDARKDDKERLWHLRSLGNLRLTGELFKLKKNMITGKIVHSIIQKLLDDLWSSESEAKVEVVCNFLNTIGKELDGLGSISKRINDDHFVRLEKYLSNHPQLDMRPRSLIQNIINLRSKNWVSIPEE